MCTVSVLGSSPEHESFGQYLWLTSYIESSFLAVLFHTKRCRCKSRRYSSALLTRSWIFKRLPIQRGSFHTANIQRTFRTRYRCEQGQMLKDVAPRTRLEWLEDAAFKILWKQTPGSKSYEICWTTIENDHNYKFKWRYHLFSGPLGIHLQNRQSSFFPAENKIPW